jgi:hypothetical protein
MKQKMLILISVMAVSVGLALSLMAADSGAKTPAKLRHVVAFKFKSTATSEQIKQVEEAFRGLKKKIPQIAEFEWGLNNSPEKHNKGCTHGFILTFKSEKDRDDYKEFGQLVGPLLDDGFVIDVWAKD